MHYSGTDVFQINKGLQTRSLESLF